MSGVDVGSQRAWYFNLRNSAWMSKIRKTHENSIEWQTCLKFWEKTQIHQVRQVSHRFGPSGPSNQLLHAAHTTQGASLRWDSAVALGNRGTCLKNRAWKKHMDGSPYNVAWLDMACDPQIPGSKCILDENTAFAGQLSSIVSVSQVEVEAGWAEGCGKPWVGLLFSLQRLQMHRGQWNRLLRLPFAQQALLSPVPL